MISQRSQRTKFSFAVLINQNIAKPRLVAAVVLSTGFDATRWTFVLFSYVLLQVIRKLVYFAERASSAIRATSPPAWLTVRHLG